MNLRLPELDEWTREYLDARLSLLDRWQHYKDDDMKARLRVATTAIHADDLGLPVDETGSHTLFFLELTPAEMDEIDGAAANGYLYGIRLEVECGDSSMRD